MQPKTLCMDDLARIYLEACCNNPDALMFVSAFHHYCHTIDDFVDGDKQFNAESMLDMLMQANVLYSTPFYINNCIRLQPVIANITNTYADSVAWEKSDVDWKRNVADVIRQCGNDMVVTVAWICGGYQHMRTISLKLREFAYHSQHKD